MDIKNEAEAYGLGCAMEYFSDHEEVLQMIDNLNDVLNTGTSQTERAYERFVEILKQYHEQPHLLDTHLECILDKMIGIIRNPESSMPLKHAVFKYMYVVTNVRGYKVIVRQLPHEVADFEPVLRLLEQQDPADPNTWTSRYILLLWMSIIVMIPFHMSLLDGFDPNATGDVCDNEQKTVMQRVLAICETYTVQPDKCRDAAAFLISKFLTRIDVKEKYLEKFLKWACTLSLSQTSNSFVKYGTLASIAMILKHGKRDDVLPHAQKLLMWIVNDDFRDHKGSNIQKLVYKIIQRIGLTYLPPKVAKWRYLRGNRSLTANLKGHGEVGTPAVPTEGEEMDDGNFEVPDDIEEILDQLIDGLRSGDGVVRWSAAKGVGRVTGRLPKELADDVVGSVLELFSPRESDGAWHGGCLALAELGRRGLLLPSRLPEVVPVVMQALIYDEPKGYASVGSHIRDSACYVCWSFARAYEITDLEPFVNEIAAQLLIVTCFDREINCRRAASAAFQENVGRQGTFPHGIDILTAADFFAVSVRNNAYLGISVFIAKYEEYTIKLINHLVERKVPHWDIAIRDLTSTALNLLTPLAPDYMATTVLDELLIKTLSIDLNSRHGSVIALGEIFHGLSAMKQDITVLNSHAVEVAKTIVGSYRERLYFRGIGGELMRTACCSFIRKCSQAHMPYHDDAVTEDWLNLLNDCIAYDAVNIRCAAVDALPYLLEEYYINNNEKHSNLVDLYIKKLCEESLEVTRMGHALALGALPHYILTNHSDRIINALLKALVITNATQKWAEARRDIIRALTTILNQLKNDAKDADILNIIEALFVCLNEYIQDNRGDIGAWVREASMISLQTIALKFAESRAALFTSDIVEKIVVYIAQQSVEKIDRTRAIAGKSFYKIIESKIIPNIPNQQEVMNLFKGQLCETLNWNSASVTFPLFVELIQFPKYSYNVLLGLVCSIGGKTETLVKNSAHSFFEYLNQKDESEIVRICEVITQIYIDHQKVDRITVPMLKFLEKLFSSGKISMILEDDSSEFPKKVLKLSQYEINGSKDIYKLIDAINFFCQYVQINNDVSKIALVQLSIMLCHRQSYVRKSTATKLFEAILVYGDNSVIPPDNLDEVQTLLSETNWEEPVDQVKPIRNNICALMGTRIPVPLLKK